MSRYLIKSDRLLSEKIRRKNKPFKFSYLDSLIGFKKYIHGKSIISRSCLALVKHFLVNWITTNFLCKQFCDCYAAKHALACSCYARATANSGALTR